MFIRFSPILQVSLSIRGDTWKICGAPWLFLCSDRRVNAYVAIETMTASAAIQPYYWNDTGDRGGA